MTIARALYVLCSMISTVRSFCSWSTRTIRPCELVWSVKVSPLSSLAGQSVFESGAISETDEGFMLEAIDCASHGSGHTFPNPSVGCVLVEDNATVIGRGFHPRAGFPHAEVFALLEASGHVECGVKAALSVVDKEESNDDILALSDTYASVDGPNKLFGGAFTDRFVTAYVTLEPCCHTGRTPPCAVSLAHSQVDRVVVGFRDPNPRVDGGGVQLLVDASINVDLVQDSKLRKLHRSCKDLVTNFVKRISPRSNWPSDSYDNLVTGGMRAGLRAVAGRQKTDGILSQISWGGSSTDESIEDLEHAISKLCLEPEWMEHLDDLLWRNELVLVRLNSAVKKKKAAKLLGGRIAGELQAHVVQTLGHTSLLYRPGLSPVLDLGNL